VNRHKLIVWSLRAGAAAFLVGLWLYSNRPGGISKLLLPKLGDVLVLFGETLVTSEFWQTVGLTVTEILVAFLIAAVLGPLVGFWAARGDLRTKVVEPIMIWGYMAPLILFYPLFTLWLDIGPASKIAFAAVATVFPVTYGAIRAFRSVNEVYVRAARAFGASDHQIDWQIKLRSTLPMLASSFRIGAAYSVVTVILTEMLASKGGLGYELANASDTFAVAESFALIISIMMVVSVLQIGLDKLFSSGRAPQPS
jgi:NitT/TauT family transport system permease protein